MDLPKNDLSERGNRLVRFARLASRAAGTSCAVIVLEHGETVTFGVPAPDDVIPAPGPDWPGLHFLTWIPMPLGVVGVGGPLPGGTLSAGQDADLRDIVSLLATSLDQERRHAELVEVTDRAARADAMLRQVSEAASCADALTSLLGELCAHHGAVVGRIWRLSLSDGLMHEVSRFADDKLDENSYYRKPPTVAVRAGNSMTAEAIRNNTPQAFQYSAIEDKSRYVLLEGAIEAGLQSQVSYPIWVQEQRFGIALAFMSERPDLDAIIADIDALSNTIRPALLRKVTEDRIRFLAHHDDLTQLGNRAVFNERLADALAPPDDVDQGLALLYLDLDGFKLVNDSRGHEVGDKVLAAVAGRLRASVREGDTIARIGGDEFAIIHPAAGQPYAATQLAQRLVQAIAQPFNIDGQPLTIGVSIGIALHPSDGRTPDVLQRNADAALYEAKQGGRNTFRLFEKSLRVLQQERLLIERDMKNAIERRDFTLAYQPIVDCATLRLCGLEALLRWDHPTRGPLSPSRFVQIAEASGLILPLGGWALHAACMEAATWERPVGLSVNFSPMQFRQAGLAKQIEGVLSRTGLSAGRLDLEVTEGLLLDDSGLVLRTMHELREMGVRMTLDDFGTAYASLSTLRRFPFDRIKIDKSFIQGMCEDDGTLAIVQAILSLSHRLKLQVIAEGVETEQELARLREIGCGLVQGFLTGRPVPVEVARKLTAEPDDEFQELAGRAE